VITYPEPQAYRHPVQKDRDEQRRPSEEEERRDCANVKQHQDRRGLPVQPILCGLIIRRTSQLQGGRNGHNLSISYERRRAGKLFKIAHVRFCLKPKPRTFQT
jgi:hypothetical protein